jgi:O-antigen ligase
MPVVTAGFVIIGILPAFLAVIDVGALLGASFDLRLKFWNQPWLWAALLTQTGFLLDFRCAKKPWIEVSKPDFILIGVLLLQAAVLGHTVSANPAAADLHLLRILAALATGVAAYYGMQHYGARFLTPVYAVLIIGMALTIPPLLYFLYAVPDARVLGGAIKWAMPGMGPLRVYGAGLEVALVVSLALWATTGRGPLVKGALLCAMVAFWTILFWSGARGGMLSVVVAAVSISFVRPRVLFRIWAALALTAVIGAALSLLIWTPDDTSFGVWNMFERTSKATVNGIGSGRIDRWINAIDLIAQHPVFGHGLSQYSNLWPTYARADQANPIAFPLDFLMYRHLHNVVMDAFLALGIAGGIVFVGLSIRGVAKAIYRVRKWQPDLRFPALFGLLTLLAHSFFTGIYVFPQTLLFLGLFFGICLVPKPAQNKNTNG